MTSNPHFDQLNERFGHLAPSYYDVNPETNELRLSEIKVMMGIDATVRVREDGLADLTLKGLTIDQFEALIEILGPSA